MITRAGWIQPGSSSQAGGSWIPISFRNWLSQPASELSIPLPDQDAGHERHDVGQEEQDTEQWGAAQARAVEDERHRERRDDRDRQPEERELDGHRQRRPGLAVAEHVAVVLQADELERLGLVQVDVREREAEGGDHRHEREDEEADDPRRQEDEAPARLVAREWRERSSGAAGGSRSSSSLERCADGRGALVRAGGSRTRAVGRSGRAYLSQIAWSSALEIGDLRVHVEAGGRRPLRQELPERDRATRCTSASEPRSSACRRTRCRPWRPASRRRPGSPRTCRACRRTRPARPRGRACRRRSEQLRRALAEEVGEDRERGVRVLGGLHDPERVGVERRGRRVPLDGMAARSQSSPASATP